MSLLLKQLHYNNKKVTKTLKYDCIYGDTDSIMVSFGLKSDDDLEDYYLTEAVAHYLSKEISKTLRKPHDLEAEDIYLDGATFIDKKRYFSQKREAINVTITKVEGHNIWFNVAETLSPIKYKSRGINKRDFPHELARVYKEVLTYMREGKEFHNSFVLPFLKSLLQHKVRIDKLVCTKSLKAERDYKNPDSIGHLQLSSKFLKPMF